MKRQKTEKEEQHTFQRQLKQLQQISTGENPFKTEYSIRAQSENVLINLLETFKQKETQNYFQSINFHLNPLLTSSFIDNRVDNLYQMLLNSFNSCLSQSYGAFGNPNRFQCFCIHCFNYSA